MKQVKKTGFTLVETMIAVGVIGVLLVVFVAMFVPAQKSINTSLTLRESDRLVRALENELTVLRPTERLSNVGDKSNANQYLSTFDKAFYWMQGTLTPKHAIIVYSYRGNLAASTRRDGTYAPIQSTTYMPGQDSILVTGVMRADNAERADDLKYAVGPVYIVKMTQMVQYQKNGREFQYMLAPAPGTISEPRNYKNIIRRPEEYMSKPDAPRNKLAWGGDVVYLAEFYMSNTNDPKSLSNLTWEKMKKPVFSRILVFRR